MSKKWLLKTENHNVSIRNGCITLEAQKVSPVVVSVPHDGLGSFDFRGLFLERSRGYKGRDKYVWPIVKDIALRYPVSAIRGLIPRAFIDYNRSWPVGINYYPKKQKEADKALDDDKLADAYSYYHGEIDRLISLAIRKYGIEKCLLIDLHGFSKQPPYAPEGGFDLIFGTGNRKTILYGNIDRKLYEFLRYHEYRVFLPEELSVDNEEDYYSADFTTRNHSETKKVNAIQIEVASKFRQKENVELGRKLSTVFAEFFSECYLQ